MRFIALLLLLSCAFARAGTGAMEIPGLEDDGPVTLFYPADAADQAYKRGPFTVQLAWQATPKKGNGRLVVLSHGSGGSAWTYTDLATAFVADGFVVAVPEHKGDNYRDRSGIGPPSWKRRPLEVSRAIDAVLRDARFAPLVAADRVGVYGMSAGGHTALSLAGGKWSPAQLVKHCDAHIVEDFNACVGLATELRGDMFDGLKVWTALRIIHWRMDSDTTWYEHRDPRVRAIVAGVPYAADFDLATLSAPAVPLGYVRAGGDLWLTPKWHGDAVFAACKSCERIADVPNGGHGALLSPLPPGLDGLVGKLLNDPPGFDRKILPDVDRKIVAFFRKHL